MSTTNRPSRARSHPHSDRVVALLASVVLAGLIVLIAAAIANGLEVAYRNAGCVTMSATPQAIGTGLSRIDYYLHNDADSVDDIRCGYNTATLNGTPGPSSGDELEPGEGKHICVFADQIVYCNSAGTAKVCFDESRMVTPTPTPP